MYGTAALRVYDNDSVSIATHEIVARNGALNERLRIWVNLKGAAHCQLWVSLDILAVCRRRPVHPQLQTYQYTAPAEVMGRQSPKFS